MTVPYSLIIILLVVLGCLLWKHRAVFKSTGDFGEYMVSKELEGLGPGYEVLNDILFVPEYGKTSQIDHLVISPCGIFVIETKNYKGNIFGTEKAEKWKQSLVGESHYFLNPVKQNWAHVFALKKLLPDYPKVRYYPIVVFAGTANLDNVERGSVPVIYIESLCSIIRTYSLNGVCLSNEDIQAIKLRIKSVDNDEESAKQQHIRYVNQVKIDREIKMNNMICPRCDGKLVLRQGVYGEFYGCSNYPKCKFTMQK